MRLFWQCFLLFQGSNEDLFCIYFGPGKPSNIAATLKVSNQVSKLKRGWAQVKVTKNTSGRDKFDLVPLKIVLQQPRPNSPLHPNSSTSREAMPNVYDSMGPNWGPEITKKHPQNRRISSSIFGFEKWSKSGFWQPNILTQSHHATPSHLTHIQGGSAVHL